MTRVLLISAVLLCCGCLPTLQRNPNGSIQYDDKGQPVIREELDWGKLGNVVFDAVKAGLVAGGTTAPAGLPSWVIAAIAALGAGGTTYAGQRITARKDIAKALEKANGGSKPV